MSQHYFVDFRLLKLWYFLYIFGQIWCTDSKKLHSLKIHNTKFCSPAEIQPIHKPRIRPAVCRWFCGVFLQSLVLKIIGLSLEQSWRDFHCKLISKKLKYATNPCSKAPLHLLLVLSTFLHLVPHLSCCQKKCPTGKLCCIKTTAEHLRAVPFQITLSFVDDLFVLMDTNIQSLLFISC